MLEKPLKIGKDHRLARWLVKTISEGYSPSAACSMLGKTPETTFSCTLCRQTVYKYIENGDLWTLTKKELRYKSDQKRTYNRVKAAKAPRGDSIEHRPEHINNREEPGHWEMDSVMGTVGSSRALVVLTERLTRAGIILPVPAHTAASVVRALNGLERRLGKDFYPMFQSITVDNGCEFQDYDGMEKACRRKGKRTTVYYCHPHAPHERGSNENMNRIIRRFFPKGTNFDEVPISEIRRAEEWMNNYPREVLGWQTAATLLRSYMSAC